ncbi:MAG: hypothetical protein DLM67_24935 [Candidatus Nephthysia bennettiae]|uniref:Uncharacterized protein n=1 Tax=Candidatus Nephthysia bennettiae TaxID=3127016 RepID=A0A934NB66_9BACT|nr:hypothetical protein [Candidatus Dormibacteraeota bacterium]PZR85895.1 MAG: hypothetical protein DLM67_24935 [Candidatus Dormibacteraeota bacterium]
MSKKYVVVLTVGLAIPTFLLSRVIWPNPPGAPVPPSGLLPFLMVPAVSESLAFGAGVAFLVAAGRALLGRTEARGLAVAAYASAGWALVSWWPHSNMHRVNTSFQGLVVIDWTFHLTLIAGAAVIGVYLYRALATHEQLADGRDLSNRAPW